MAAPLPEILIEHRVGDVVEIDLRVAAGLFCFDGHFPGFPILPGVVQVDWAISLGRRHFCWPGAFCALEQVKFSRVVLPESRLHLTLRSAADRPHLSFVYAADGQTVSSGRVVFAGQT